MLPNVSHNKIIIQQNIQYCLSQQQLHRNAPALAFQGDMGWMIPKYKYYISSIRLWNKIYKMDAGHLTRKIFEWSYRHFDVCSWESNIDNINRVSEQAREL